MCTNIEPFDILLKKWFSKNYALFWCRCVKILDKHH